MSLEKDIHALTTAINALTMAIGNASRTATPAPTPVPLEVANALAKAGIPPGPVERTHIDPPVEAEKPKPRRKRRSKAEMEAARAEVEAAKADRVEAAVEELKAEAPPNMEAARAEAEAAKADRVEAAVEELKAEAAAVPEEAPKALIYDDDLRPRVAAFAGAQPANERRDAMVKLFAQVGMPNGTELAKNPDLFADFDKALTEVGY